jgi:ABC-2 type transport system ATP-binding protein
MDSAIEITNLCKDYQNFSLKNVTFSLPTGHIMGFVGQNGAGKTTTIRAILNMVSRKSGSINILGMDNILDEQKIKQDIAVVFDEIYFVDSWKLSDVEKALKGFYVNWSSSTYKQYIETFNLSMDKKVKDLSRGMKVKLMIAVALSHEAKLLILDEPTSGIDPVAREELLEILSSYVSDGYKSVLFSTHITMDLEKIADYVTLIDNGKIFYSGTKDKLIESFSLIKGDKNDLLDSFRDKLIGLSIIGTGFSGLIHSADTKFLTKEIVAEPPTIDDILVYISKGDKNFG